MTEATDITPLVQRIAIQRLAAPGILDQRKLQRVHEKFSAPARAPMLSRLFRCAQPAAPSAQGLPVVRIDRYAETDSPSLTHPVAASAQIMSASNTKPDAGGADSFATAKLARQSPGVTHSHEPVARSSSGNVGIVAGQTSIRPLVRAVEVGGGLVQRVAESTVSARAVAVRQTPPAALMAFRQADPVRASDPIVPATKVPGASASAAPLTAFRQANFAQASAPMLLRSLATAASKPSSTGMSSTAAKTATASFAPLLFRKPDITAPAAQVSGKLPTITPAAPGVISRTAAAPASNPGQVFAAAPDVAMDIDWIAQQVSSRLERRLDIERERLGVRPWRQSNY